jgi:hypothetical protein
MSEVLSKMRSSLIVPQGNPLLATDLILIAAPRHVLTTLRSVPQGTIPLCRDCLLAGQAHWPGGRFG